MTNDQLNLKRIRRVVTLTTDFGNANHNVAALKGSIVSYNENVDLVDISHEVSHFDIVQGAYILGNAYPYFPIGTIHIVGMNFFYQTNSTILLLPYNDHFFIAPNNGILSLLTQDDIPKDVRKISVHTNIKSLYNGIGKTIRELESSDNIDTIGSNAPDLYNKYMIRPVVSENTIRGTVLLIDSFGNIITNIKRELFEKVRKGRSFNLYFRHKNPITQLHTHYCEVSIGDELCLFNSAGYLEIAINMGRANSILGIIPDETIQIDFN